MALFSHASTVGGGAVFPQVGRGRTDVAHTFENWSMVGVR